MITDDVRRSLTTELDSALVARLALPEPVQTHLRESWHELVMGSARWRPFAVVAGGPDRPAGVAIGRIVTLTEAAKSYALSACLHRRDAERATGQPRRDGDQERLAVVGGPARLRGGLYLSPRSGGAARRLEVARELVGSIRDALPAATGGILLYAVPEDQVGLLAAVAARPVVVRAAGAWSEFTGLTRFEDLDDFVARLPRKTRATWRSERHEGAGEGMACEAATSDVLREASPLICRVSRRNGVEDHPRLVELRLRMWAANQTGEPRAFTLRGAGELRGICLYTEYADALDLYEVGMHDDGADRALAYKSLVFHAPVRRALERRLDTVTLGLGHEDAKRIHGAAQTPHYDLWLER